MKHGYRDSKYHYSQKGCHNVWNTFDHQNFIWADHQQLLQLVKFGHHLMGKWRSDRVGLLTARKSLSPSRLRPMLCVSLCGCILGGECLFVVFLGWDGVDDLWWGSGAQLNILFSWHKYSLSDLRGKFSGIPFAIRLSELMNIFPVQCFSIRDKGPTPWSIMLSEGPMHQRRGCKVKRYDLIVGHGSSTDPTRSLTQTPLMSYGSFKHTVYPWWCYYIFIYLKYFYL